MKDLIVAGVDGCRAGWFAVLMNGHDCIDYGIYSAFNEIWKDRDRIDLMLLDIHIGLASKDSDRNCDKEARKILGSRASSIFPSPSRSTFSATTYEKASKLNHAELGKKLSKQSWFVLPKIKEVDEFLQDNQNLWEKIWESHPEINFKYLNGSDLKHSKKTPEGRSERMKIIKNIFPKAEKLFSEVRSKYLKKHLTDDDIIDAMGLAAGAGICIKDGFVLVPEEVQYDLTGLRMQMKFPKTESSSP